MLSLLALNICGMLSGRALRVAAILSAVAVYWGIIASGDAKAGLPPVASLWAPNLVLTGVALTLIQGRSCWLRRIGLNRSRRDGV